MASNKNLNTRIQLKYDTFAAWTSADPVLLAGEIAVVVVPAATNAVVQEPAILTKVGDGTSKFSALPWTSAIAADVHAWAKAAEKPAYAASEITGMGDFIADYVDETLGISVDTNTLYKVEATEDGMGFVLSSQNKGEAAWATEATVNFSEKFVKSIASGNTDGTILVDGVEVTVKGLGSAAFTDASAYEPAGTLTTQYNLFRESLDATALDLGLRIDEVETTHANDKTTLENSIAAEAARATAAEEANAAAIAAEKERMDAFMNAAEVGEAAVDTMKEIQDYITSDGAAADQMVKDIGANKTAIEAEVARATEVEETLAQRLSAVENYDHAADIKAAEDYADSLATNYDKAGAAAEVASDVEAKLIIMQADIDEKVSAEEGKGLSSNDYTTAEKEKLASIAENAQVNTIEKILVNGVEQAITDKAVDLSIVTNIADLEQTEDTYVIFNCGSATVNI